MNQHTRRDFLQSVVVLGGATLLGCGGSPAENDAGMTGNDAGMTGNDAGMTGNDAGMTGNDAGTTGTDAGTTGTDAGTTGTDAGAAACTAVTTTIALNHGHELVVPLADVTAAVDHTYDIMGTSLHTHSVTVTAAQFTTIAGGGTVMIISTSGGAHTHEVTVVCGPG